MLDDSRSSQRREITGFAVSVGFVCLAAVRDVYLGGVFQRITPLLIAIVAFTLCTVVFLPTAIVSSRNSLAILRHRLGDLFWVNITSAIAWITFLYGLKLIEPLVVQILYSGIGPLSVIWIERNLSGGGRGTPITRGERLAYLGLLVTLAFSALITLTGLSGMTRQSAGSAVLGVILATSGGISISVSTMLCRKLTDAGVTPSALLSLRFPATALSAAAMMSLFPLGLSSDFFFVDAIVLIALLLIIVPNYVNLVAISLASPLTVRVVLAVGPVLIFFGQLVEGRLTVSLYSLMAAILYGLAAISAAIARQHAIRTAETHVVT